MIEKCQHTEFLMERLRRQSQSMSRDELLALVDSLSRMYSSTKAVANWLVQKAAGDFAANC